MYYDDWIMGSAKPGSYFVPVATAVFSKAEENEILETLRSGWITIGPRTKIFEENLQKYLGVKHAIAMSSCSAALHLSLIAAGVGRGDEVITTTLTFAATVNAIIHTGATPVLVDIERDTLNISLEEVQRKITKKTKAIIPVHYGGLPIDMDRLSKIAKKHKLIVIEDAAHAIGAKYKGKHIGSHSPLVCFSFHPVKNMTTGDGGAIVTNDHKLAEKVNVLRVNGMSKDAWKRTSKEGNWDYSVVAPGYKYHMNDLAAALGIHQLKKLNNFIVTRRKIVDFYDRAFSKNELIETRKNRAGIKGLKHAYNLYPILIDVDRIAITRNEVMEHLKKRNIGTVVYYRPLHTQPYYKRAHGLDKKNFPNAEYVFKRLICLPLYAGMTLRDAAYVSREVGKVLGDHRR